ncbi:MAG: transketolase [Planctomycetes bacterium]|nr:transketolase [Planctomycetota bacterium]
MSLAEMNVDQLCVSTLRTLSIDAVSAANSGHPGAPLGCAAIVHALWSRFMRFNPAAPDWQDRDRFILSAGHASALLYSILHLSGYALPLEELRKFRRLGSMTPGHPEAGCAPGVETTTGPLGQGLGNAVGMAIAERYLAAHFNRPGHVIVDHYTYVLASDGDLMEGISQEAASLAGHLGLGKLIVLYDDNMISLEGPTSGWFTDDTAARFQACGWQAVRAENADSDVDAVCAAIAEARATDDKPSIILCRTHIGYASPLEGSHKAHGAPLNAEQVRATKRNLGWPEDSEFLVPDRAHEFFAALADKGRRAHQAWQEQFSRYAEKYPDLAAEWRLAAQGGLPEGWDESLPSWTQDDAPLSTRVAAGVALEAMRKRCWNLIGGCADLASSTRTLPTDGESMDTGRFDPQNIRFGVREHLMAAACSGIARHGLLRAYGSTFTVFSDYARPALRLAAMMGVGVIYQFTHDSIALGEDGPTHQPVGQLAALRCIPNWTVIRPADANEAAEAWKVALSNTHGPTAIICTRQKLPVLDRSLYPSAALLEKGAYVLADPDEGEPAIILMASGSEVHTALAAARRLSERGIAARVVSFPSWELFERQPQDYKDSVLPPQVEKRVAVEAASPMGWERYTGQRGTVIGLDRFGASGPGEEVMKLLGFSPENVEKEALALLGAE